MKGSPIFPGFDSDYNENSSYEFDPRADFTQFLEEARRYANDNEVVTPIQSGKKQEVVDIAEKKPKKKSWKTALFSLWKKPEDKKKNKPCQKEAPMNSNFANAKPRGYVSGPIYRNRGAGDGGRHRLPMSGPLTNLFHAKKREENGTPIVPYVSLDRLNRPQYDAKAYGPVYLVS